MAIPMNAGPVRTPAGTLRRRMLSLLTEARERTLHLVGSLGEDDARRQHDPLLSPIVWDLGHIAHFEALWLTRNLSGPIEFVEMPGLFNPFENPRAVRGTLELPGIGEATALLAQVRRDVLARLQQVEFDPANPLLAEGYVYRMVAQHEFQHGETMLQALQIREDEPWTAPRSWELPGGRRLADPGAMARFPGGRVVLGTDDRTTAYDNERPAHAVELPPFRIGITPVTNGEYLEFMAAGGYERAEWWSEAGWAWRESEDVEAPKYWFRRDGEWHRRIMERVRRVDPQRPVCHVAYWEADAFARWAGKRLPTEAEWEAACTWDPALGRARAFPWGDEPPTPARANVDQLTFDTAAVGAYPQNVSPIGCYGMIGDVWEWTATPFDGYPGFEPFPYPEYSEAFFGTEYQVLRGGSWATRPGAVRGTFRNWDYPQRRQIFSGFRCAADA